MSNPANNSTVKTNGTTATVAKTETVATEKSLATVQDHRSADQSSVEIVPQIQVVESKSANAVFERLEDGLKMKEQFNKAKERVTEFEDFSKNYEDEGLIMKIENVGTGDSIQIQNVAMILDFINNLVKTGKTHLKALENEIVNFTI